MQPQVAFAPEAPAPVVAPPVPILGISTTLMLSLLAALAAIAAAAVLRVQRARRIARTRAALVLAPRLDLAAGTSAFQGLSLTAPPLAIRAWLAT